MIEERVIKKSITETRYVVHDVEDNEIVVDNKELAQALDVAVIKAKNAYDYICNEVEKNYVNSLNIKKGDLIKVVPYWPENGTYSRSYPYYGVYDGIVIDRFDKIDNKPIFMIKMLNVWISGSTSVSHEYPYRDIPCVNMKRNCQFNPIKDNFHVYHEVRLVTEEEKKKYADALIEALD